jgi:hypothetical protein
MQPITDFFVANIHHFITAHDLGLVSFGKGEDKDAIAQRYLAEFPGREGVLFVGRAQEKASVFRTQKRRNLATGTQYLWLTRATVQVNYFYFYCVDDDFGPFFLKFCTYFPYNARLCLNGNHWAQRQAAKAGVGFQPLDNAFAAVDDVPALQAICDSLGEPQIQALLDKWLRILPHPFTEDDIAAGYRYDLSVIQAEFSLTQMLDRPVTGRIFLEQMIRDNLDLGRPDRASLIFARRIHTGRKRRTPGTFRTRIITDDVTPTVRIEYKKSKIKQYLTTRKDEHCAPRPSSTTPATSTSANGCPTCLHYGRSASPPTDVSSTSNASATTPPTVRPRSPPSPIPSSPRPAPASPACASPTPASKPS